jgi:hypothetical protein
MVFIVDRFSNVISPFLFILLLYRSNAREENPIGSPIAATNRSNTIARAPRSNGVPHSRASPSVRSSGSPEESDILPYITKRILVLHLVIGNVQHQQNLLYLLSPNGLDSDFTSALQEDPLY